MQTFLNRKRTIIAKGIGSRKKYISIQESNKINNQCKGAENSQNTCAANILGNLSSAQAEKASKRKNAVQRANKIEIKKPKL